MVMRTIGADSSGRGNGSELEIAMTTQKRTSNRSARDKMRLPGRSEVAHRAQPMIGGNVVADREYVETRSLRNLPRSNDCPIHPVLKKIESARHAYLNSRFFDRIRPFRQAQISRFLTNGFPTHLTI